MGREAAISPPKSFRQLFRHGNIFGRLDAAADGDQNRRLRQVHGLLCFAEKLQRLGANLLGFQIRRSRPSLAALPLARFAAVIGAKSAGLKRRDPRRLRP